MRRGRLSSARRAAFRRLHESGCFVIPNPWDIGTARYLRHLGFKALATTSSGFCVLARSARRGLGGAARRRARPHRRDRRGDRPAGERRFRVGLRARAGRRSPRMSRLLRRDRRRRALDRGRRPAIRASRSTISVMPSSASARRARRSTPPATDVLLTARAECYLVGHPDPLPESIRRLQAYAEAGADVLYAPGPRTRERHRGDRRGRRAEAGQHPRQQPCRADASPTSRRSACGASASARRSRAPRGQASSAPRS